MPCRPAPSRPHLPKSNPAQFGCRRDCQITCADLPPRLAYGTQLGMRRAFAVPACPATHRLTAGMGMVVATECERRRTVPAGVRRRVRAGGQCLLSRTDLGEAAAFAAATPRTARKAACAAPPMSASDDIEARLLPPRPYCDVGFECTEDMQCLPCRRATGRAEATLASPAIDRPPRVTSGHLERLRALHVFPQQPNGGER